MVGFSDGSVGASIVFASRAATGMGNIVAQIGPVDCKAHSASRLGQMPNPSTGAAHSPFFGPNTASVLRFDAMVLHVMQQRTVIPKHAQIHLVNQKIDSRLRGNDGIGRRAAR
jgi:hypothetical protein